MDVLRNYRGVIGNHIHANNKTFTVRHSYGRTASSPHGTGGITVPEAFKEYGPSIIKHKDLDFLSTNKQISKDLHYGRVMLEISPTMSKLMGANSVENGEIASLPLGDMGRENGKIFIEGSYEGETTRMLLFSEAQAKKMGIDLNKPAFVAIEDGYNIVDVHKYGYAIDVPEIALPNLRIYYGSFYNGALRHVDGEFSIPVKEIAQAFDAETTRYFYYFKPGPAVREYSGDPSDNFRVSFGPVDRLLWHGRFGVLSDES